MADTQAAPRTVHLAVGHSGWTSAPPGPVPQTPSLSSETLSQYRTTSQQEQPTYRLPEYDPDYAPGRRYPSWTPPTPGLTPSASYASARSSGTSISGTTATTNRRSAFQPRPELEYVYYMHQKALNALCPEILVAQQVDDPLVSRNAAMASLERRGWLWPAVLDEDFPRATPSLVEYAPAVVEYVASQMFFVFVLLADQYYLFIVDSDTCNSARVPTARNYLHDRNMRSKF